MYGWTWSETRELSATLLPARMPRRPVNLPNPCTFGKCAFAEWIRWIVASFADVVRRCEKINRLRCVYALYVCMNVNMYVCMYVFMYVCYRY